MYLNNSTEMTNPQRAKFILKNGFPISFKRTIYHYLGKIDMLLTAIILYALSIYVRIIYGCYAKGLKAGYLKFIFFIKMLTEVSFLSHLELHSSSMSFAP